VSVAGTCFKVKSAVTAGTPDRRGDDVGQSQPGAAGSRPIRLFTAGGNTYLPVNDTIVSRWLEHDWSLIAVTSGMLSFHEQRRGRQVLAALMMPIHLFGDEPLALEAVLEGSA
jgi:hypothetical protein